MRMHFERLCPRGPAPRVRPGGCFRPETPPHLPDPGLYSQAERFNAGQPFTLQNPDIGQTVRVQPGPGGATETVGRTLNIGVMNFSDDAPAAGVLVEAFGGRWGIGLALQAIGAFTADLGRASAPNARASYALELGEDSPHRVFFVRVSHSKDRNAANNEGWDAQQRQNVEAGAFALPFTVRNRLQRSATIEFVLTNGAWSAALSSTALSMLPGQNAVVTMSGVADLTGMTSADREEFSIIATIDGAFYGGLTYRLGPGAG